MIKEFDMDNGEHVISSNSDVMEKTCLSINDLYKLYLHNMKIFNLHGSVEISLTEHCNLNCKLCDRFSPYSESWFEKESNFEIMIHRLSLLFPNLSNISLMGGEPLLHPNICNFFKIARFYFKNNIVLFTNGILLTSEDENFYNQLIKYNIILRVTKYPWCNIEINDIIKICVKYNVRLEIIFRNEFDIPPIMKDGNFNNYCRKNKIPYLLCFQLRSNGDLYNCPVSANAYKYNKKYITIKNKDYINIYDNNNKEIFRFINKKPLFCNTYCKAVYK